MAKYLITGADGQLGQCFQSVAHEFLVKHVILFLQIKMKLILHLQIH